LQVDLCNQLNAEKTDNKIIKITNYFFIVTYYSITCRQWPPLAPQKVAVVHRWLLSRGFSIKIGVKISLARLCLAVVESGLC
jgi:hypothetical protein